MDAEIITKELHYYEVFPCKVILKSKEFNIIVSFICQWLYNVLGPQIKALFSALSSTGTTSNSRHFLHLSC